MRHKVCGRQLPQTLIQALKTFLRRPNPNFSALCTGFAQQTTHVMPLVSGIEMEVDLGHARKFKTFN
jgi:hypothetical protein